MTSVPHGLLCLSHHLSLFFPYQSSTRYFTPPPLCPDTPHFLSIFPSLSSSSALHFPPLSTVYRSILSPSLSHLHAHHIHCSTFPNFSTSYIPPSSSFLLFLHTYKSHTEGLLLIFTCWGLHLFCMSRDPTMQFPVPRTH